MDGGPRNRTSDLDQVARRGLGGPGCAYPLLHGGGNNVRPGPLEWRGPEPPRDRKPEPAPSPPSQPAPSQRTRRLRTQPWWTQPWWTQPWLRRPTLGPQERRYRRATPLPGPRRTPLRRGSALSFVSCLGRRPSSPPCRRRLRPRHGLGGVWQWPTPGNGRRGNGRWAEGGSGDRRRGQIAPGGRMAVARDGVAWQLCSVAGAGMHHALLKDPEAGSCLTGQER